MRVNVVDVPASWGDACGVLAAVRAALLRAPASDLVLLPELALTGYVSPDAELDPTPFAEPEGGPTARAYAELAVELGTTIVGPLVLAEQGGRSFSNAMLAFSPGGEPLFTYRKRHPWFPETWATAGTSPPPVVTIAGARVTVCVCFDVHFAPDDMRDELTRADLLLFPSAWVDEEDTRVSMLRALAARFHVAIAAANWGEGILRVPGQGSSCILDASGRTLASTPRRGRGAIEIVTATLAFGA